MIKIKILIERYSTLFLILISIFIFIFTTLLLNHILLSKKESIEVYSVFGEQPSHIILPHIVKFLGIGILGWGSALAISLIIYRYIVDQLSQHQYFLFISQRLHFLSLSTIFISLIPYILSLVLSYYLFRKKIIHLYYSYEK